MDALRNWLWQWVQDAARLEQTYRVRGRALDAGEAGLADALMRAMQAASRMLPALPSDGPNRCGGAAIQARGIWPKTGAAAPALSPSVSRRILFVACGAVSLLSFEGALGLTGHGVPPDNGFVFG
ncbi:MAG: hypothetical protein ABJG86_15415 [Nitratireductor sp.]|uniref:hypothetical protein n=1 Tax=Parvibaculum sp. TaxID=2024848 RepID=UPI00328F4D65